MSTRRDWFETDDAETEQKFEPEPCTAPPRYSAPFESAPAGEMPVTFAGFMRDGSPGYVLRYPHANKKPVLVEATAENRANEHPGGFFSSLARLLWGPR